MCHVGQPRMRGLSALEATDLVRVREASDRSGIPRRTIYEWVKHEKVWSIRIGGVIFLHRDDVELMSSAEAGGG